MSASALLYHRRDGDTLRAAGRDVISLLSRLAASDVTALTDGRATPLLLTSDKGRVLDLAMAIPQNDEVHIVCGAGRANAVREWLDAYVIVDDARFELLDESFIFELLSPAAVLAHPSLIECPIGFAAASLVELEAAAADRLETTLQNEGWASLSPPRLRERRVRLGQLAPGVALASGLNPLEAGLRHLVSFDKGCYIGQEVVARLENYDKVHRALALVRGSGEPPAAGEALLLAAKKCGRVLDAVSDLAGSFAALVIAESDLAEGTELVLESNTAGILTWIPAAR